MTTAHKRYLRQRRRARLRPYHRAWKLTRPGIGIVTREEFDAWAVGMRKLLGIPITVEVAPGVFQHTYSFEEPPG